MMKRWFAIGIFLIASMQSAHADEASKRAKVEELIVVMHMDRLTGQMLNVVKNQVEQMTKASTAQDALTPAQKEAIATFQAKCLKLVGDSMSWDNLKGDFINLYVQTFTEDEIDGMIGFYKSPSGQAVLAKMPQLQTASMKVMQQRMVALQPQIKELQEQFMAQIQAGAAAPTQNNSTTPAPKN